MPKKIRELKAMLSRAGFTMRTGRGSHSVWTHPKLPGQPVTMSGQDGDDARRYQERMVERAVAAAGEKP